MRRLAESIRTMFAGHPNYLRVRGEPVLAWLWSGDYDGDLPLLAQMARGGTGFCNIAISSRAPALDEKARTSGFFRGFGLGTPFPREPDEDWEQVLANAYGSASDAGMDVRIATVSPGFELGAEAVQAKNVRQRRPTIPRLEGETYVRSIRAAERLDPAPDLILVVSYNNFHSNTHIEPTRSTGLRYVELTEAFVQRLKSGRLDA